MFARAYMTEAAEEVGGRAAGSREDLLIAVSDLDIYRTAKILLEARGEAEARSYAAAQMLEQADPDAQAAWRRIVAALEVLTAAGKTRH